MAISQVTKPSDLITALEEEESLDFAPPFFLLLCIISQSLRLLPGSFPKTHSPCHWGLLVSSELAWAVVHHHHPPYLDKAGKETGNVTSWSFTGFCLVFVPGSV